MKASLISSIVIALLTISAFTFLNKQTPQISLSPTPSPSQENIDIKASFTIITGNITRSFKAEKYHNQSVDVFVTAADPTIIHVKKVGITYDDFFKTLPMKLTSDCLTTGDGETLCSGKEETLKFFLNDIETSNLLEKEIEEGDKVLIKYD